jgi:chemotaxis protein methyltransferase CheR
MTQGVSNISASKILSGLLEARTGQVISANRFWRIETALQPVMRQYDIPDLEALVAVLLSVENEELQGDIIDAMLNNESSFFRDTPMFELLQKQLIPHFAKQKSREKRLRIWSSGCATGQEPYSLAMMFAEESYKWKDWSVEIVATDISQTALNYAKAGIYSQFEIQRGLSVEWMLRYFSQDGTRWRISDNLRSKVNFRQDNLLRTAADLRGFDIILCRNVVMYFSPEARHQAFQRLAQALNPNGYIMLGAAETVIGCDTEFSVSKSFRGCYEHGARRDINLGRLAIRA